MLARTLEMLILLHRSLYYIMMKIAQVPRWFLVPQLKSMYKLPVIVDHQWLCMKLWLPPGLSLKFQVLPVGVVGMQAGPKLEFEGQL